MRRAVMSSTPRRLVVTLSLALPLGSCGADHTEDLRRAGEIARAIVAACPLARPDDADAQRTCAARLTDLASLRDAMAEPFVWGQQTRLWHYDPAEFHTTRFNARVFRRMYLSLFMFSGTYTVEQAGDLTVVHLPYEFRNGLDPGAYPYPFWHRPTKWRDYQLATEMLLVLRDGRMVGALRSAVRLPARPHTERVWDNRWTWADGAEPHVSLYRSFFSAENPHLARVEAAYRSLESALRPHNCFACHQPDNAADANPLELFSYPNQALVARHTIREQLERNRMPPGAGIADAAERAQLITLARDFEAAADDALAADGEPTGATDAGR